MHRFTVVSQGLPGLVALVLVPVALFSEGFTLGVVASVVFGLFAILNTVFSFYLHSRFYAKSREAPTKREVIKDLFLNDVGVAIYILLFVVQLLFFIAGFVFGISSIANGGPIMGATGILMAVLALFFFVGMPTTLIGSACCEVARD